MRSAGQAVGAITLDVKTGELVKLMVGNTIVKPDEGDAKGLIGSVITALEVFVDRAELGERLAGLMFDGQYILWSVDKEVKSQLKVNLECVTVTWDCMHQIQLALNDVRIDRPPSRGGAGLHTVEWFGAMFAEVNLVLNNHQHGNGFEAIVDLAEEMEVEMRLPKKWCETRMVQSELVVYTNFLINWPLYVAYYEKAAAIPEDAKTKGGKKARTKQNAAEAAAQLCLDRLLDMAFICTLHLLVDVLRLVQTLSVFAQKVNTLPWEVLEAEEQLIAKLLLIVKDTSGAVKVLDPVYFPTLFGKHRVEDEDGTEVEVVVMDGLKKQMYRGVELVLPLVDEDDPDGERYTLEAYIGNAGGTMGVLHDEAADFCKATAYFLEERIVLCKGAETGGSDNKAPSQRTFDCCKTSRATVKLGAEAFDLRKLIEDPCPLDSRYEALDKIYVIFAENGNDLCSSFEKLEEQYKILESRLRVAATKLPFCGRRTAEDNSDDSDSWFNADGAVKSGTFIFRSLIKTKELHADVEDVVYLLVHMALKAKNEAYVEGLAGMLDRHAGGKRGIKAEEYDKEAFIHANAPPLHLADPLIHDSIDRFFTTTGGLIKPWHFKHTSVQKNKKILVNVDESAVMKRLKSKRPRLSFTQPEEVSD